MSGKEDRSRIFLAIAEFPTLTSQLHVQCLQENRNKFVCKVKKGCCAAWWGTAEEPGNGIILESSQWAHSEYSVSYSFPSPVDSFPSLQSGEYLSSKSYNREKDHISFLNWHMHPFDHLYKVRSIHAWVFF